MNLRLRAAETGFVLAATRRGIAAKDRLDKLYTCPEMLDDLEVADEQLEELLQELPSSYFDSSENEPTSREAFLERNQRGSDYYCDDSFPETSRGFDLLQWERTESEFSPTVRLVILGALLLGSLGESLLRRRIASQLQNLPPVVATTVARGASSCPGLSPPIRRRILEVFTGLAQSHLPGEEELAALGLFFLVTASAFRSQKALEAFGASLPPDLNAHFERFLPAILSTGKPELLNPIGTLLLQLELESSPPDDDLESEVTP